MTQGKANDGELYKILENYRNVNFSPVPFEPDTTEWHEKFELNHIKELKAAKAAIESLLERRENEARIDELKYVQKLFRGGMRPDLAQIFDSRLAELSQRGGEKEK